MTTDLKQARGNAQRRFDEICRLIIDNKEDSLAGLTATAMKAGLEGQKAREMWEALRRVIIEAELTAEAWAAAPVITLRSHRVVL